MSLFGPSAEEVTRKAVAAGQEAQKKTRTYLKRRLRRTSRKLAATQEQLATLTGATPRQAKEDYTRGFYNTIADIGKAYASQVSKFDPNILASSSAQRFAGALSSSLQDYTNRLNLISQQGTAQMYRALAEPINKFREISEDPAFNNLVNATYMEYATQPPTVRSDVESMRQLYTYNV